MEKTRVKKGEKYWYIASDFFAGDFYIVYGIDFYEDIHDGRFALGNYFHTKEEAEAMADKLRRVLKGVWVIDPPETESFVKKVEAVLNGADVIEMPSEEEYDNYLNSHFPYQGGAKGSICEIAKGEWKMCYHYLKSKIVK